jgi:thiol:disulfide interchange protein DsbD
VCKEVCIPEGADLTLALAVAIRAARRALGPGISAARRAARAARRWRASAIGSGTTIALTLVAAGRAADPGVDSLLPYEPDRIDPSGPQPSRATAMRIVLTLAGRAHALGSARRDRRRGDRRRRFRRRRARRRSTSRVPASRRRGPKAPRLPPRSISRRREAAAAMRVTLAIAVVSALVGGLILNLMPCVFPVLTLKVLGFATHHDTRPTHAAAKRSRSRPASC